jgi:hypothetical protein
MDNIFGSLSWMLCFILVFSYSVLSGYYSDCFMDYSCGKPPLVSEIGEHVGSWWLELVDASLDIL